MPIHHKDSDLNELTALLKAGVSPYHTIQYSAKLLTEHGFSELALGSDWSLEAGKRYFINVYDTTLVGFTLGNELTLSSVPSLRLTASHTDWPCLMVKPDPEQTLGSYGKLNVSVYGGPILNTWLDRPLSIAGKVCTAGTDPFHPEVHIFDLKLPLLTIPNLAIHFNREVNKGIELNPQVDMQPVLTVFEDSLNQEHFFLKLLAEELSCDPASILDYECFLYNCDEPLRLGIHQEMLSSPRLDNLTSVHACLSGLLESKLPDGICAAVLYDNEEIGSSTKQGAASPLLERILEKIYAALGFSRSDFLNALFNGFLLSLDVAHAVHPNHSEKSDPVDRSFFNQGVCIKTAVSQAYATDASYVSVIEDLCRRNQIPYRKFANRSDIKGGSTLGSISSCLLTMPTVDAGVPILAMHSSRELMGSSDQWALAELARKFMQS